MVACRVPRFRSQRLRLPTELGAHNDRDWFHEHEAEYSALLLEPARGLVVAMGRRLAQVVPGIHADPRVNGSICASPATPASRPTSRPTGRTSTCGSGRATAPAASAPATSCASTPTRSRWVRACTISSDAGLAAYRRAVDDDEPRRRARPGGARGPRAGARSARRGGSASPLPYTADHPAGASSSATDGLVAATTDPLPAEAFDRGVPGLVRRAAAARCGRCRPGWPRSPRGGGLAGCARRGRATSSPPQFGHTPDIDSVHAGQKVHS